MEYSKAFEIAFVRVFAHEAGFQADPLDKGNWTNGDNINGELRGTKYGISAASYPHLDIFNLTLDKAKEVYWLDFWSKLTLNEFNPALGYQLFDAAINHGMSGAIRILQRAVDVKDDGIIGPITKKAVWDLTINDLLFRFLAERLATMTHARSWDAHGRGWARRIAQNLRLAAEDN